MDNQNIAVDIVIPVFAGAEVSLACINSVYESLLLLQTKVEIVVVFDAGPDKDLLEELIRLEKDLKITLVINEKNEGFVSSANKGLNRSERDILLLNSDTLVASDWLDRIVKRAYNSTNIATVTPFSNNAEICSWPEFCQPNTVFPDSKLQDIDRTFALLNPPPINIPTAVGFCMYIKRECINRVGVFDVEKFGRGYGEENDFCMRASVLGYTHVLASDVYVYHHGGVSFGKEKKKLETKAVAKLNEMYPSYGPLVAEYIEEDPARKWRFYAEVLFQRVQGKPLVLHITHGIGGGTDKHVLELSKHCEKNLQHATLIPKDDDMCLYFPNVINNGYFEFPHSELRELKKFLFSLSLCRIHIHHAMGWDSRLFEILDILDVSYFVTLHDYYFLHPNPSLADKKGFFCESRTDRDTVCSETVALPDGVTGDAWREKWLSILKRAERVIAPSNAAAAIFNAYHPELSITCAYHPDFECFDSYPEVKINGIENEEEFHIVVLGALGKIKGADTLERVSQLAAKAKAAIRFTLVGWAYKELASTVSTTGEYEDSDLPEILKKLNPHAIWFPCGWPETYSYTLSTAMSLGFPVIAPQLGSFPERLQNRPFSWIESWKMTPQQWLKRLLEIRKEFETESHFRKWNEQPLSGFSYADDYKHPKVYADFELSSLDTFVNYWTDETPTPKQHEWPQEQGRLLRFFVWLNNRKLVKMLFKLIPLSLRHSVKMKLSPGPSPD